MSGAQVRRIGFTILRPAGKAFRREKRRLFVMVRFQRCVRFTPVSTRHPALEIPFAFVGIILLVIFIRIIAGSFDGSRVESYIRSIGGELLDCSWAPFGPGWFGEKDSRIYAIVYRDSAGSVHRAHVKTSGFSGVYLTNDEIIEDSRPALPANESEEEEKARLRRRLAELERDS